MPDEQRDCDVAVLGGGPAGAAAAARLAGRGFDVVLVDRASFPRDKVCGDFVGPMALAELAELGLDRLAGFGATTAMSRLALHVDDDPAVMLGVPEVAGIPGYGRVIPRLQLDGWIVDAARQAGATVWDGRKAEAIERAPSAITVRGSGDGGPWTLRARLLLGADGSNSLTARTLHGGPPASADRILAVRAYVDGVDGPSDLGDIWLRGDTFPGYHWLFPTGGGSANLGVGMLAATYPQSPRHLRDMLLPMIGEDPSVRRRLGAARIRGKVRGHPLTTYNPRRPVVGDRIMLLGDAAGLINPLNGEGIQYALHSARWAADVAAAQLAIDRLDAGALTGYQRRVRQSLAADMALSRLFVQLIRNRRLNQVWLRALGSMTERAISDPAYALRFGCVLTGLTSDVAEVSTGAAARIFGRALAGSVAGSLAASAADWAAEASGRRRDRLAPVGSGDAARFAVSGSEFASWAAGTGRSLAEFGIQLARASLPGSRGGRPALDRLHRLCWFRSVVASFQRSALLAVIS